MKNRFLLTTILMLALTVFAFAQQNEMIEAVAESQLNLSAQLSEKLNNIRSNPLIKSTQPIRIGSIAALQNRGAIPFSIPGRRGKLVAQTTKIEYLSEDHYTWEGTFKKEEGTAILMAREGRIFGHVSLNEKVYDIQSLENGLAVLIEYDEKALSTYTCATPDTLSHTEDTGKSLNDTNSGNQRQSSINYVNVRVLVLFTNAADNVVANINDMATLAIQQLNSAKSNSAITGTELLFTHAGTHFLNFTEDDPIFDDIEDLANDQTAQNLRNQFEADLVVLLTNGNYGTVTGIVRNIGPSDPEAYSIVQVGAATSALTFAHEVGHLMGGRHQQCNIFLNGGCDNTAGDAHGHNFMYQTGVWPFRTEHYKRTIMHQYRDEYDRISHFSNPDVDYGPKDKATGVAGSQNAARILRINAPVVEAFRNFNEPYSVSISGPYSAASGQSLSFSAYGSGGALPYQHQWWVSTDGYGYVLAGSGPTLYYTMPSGSSLYVRVNSSDSGGDSDVDFHTVSNTGGQCIKDCPPPIDPNLRVLEEETDQTLQLSYSLYPNPTKDFLTLVIDNEGEEGDVFFRIVDLQGRLMLDLKEQRLKKGYNELGLNLSELPEGLHLLQITRNDQTKALRIYKEL